MLVSRGGKTRTKRESSAHPYRTPPDIRRCRLYPTVFRWDFGCRSRQGRKSSPTGQRERVPRVSEKPHVAKIKPPVTCSALAPPLLERGTDRPETQKHELVRVQVELMRVVCIPVRSVPTRSFPFALDLNRAQHLRVRVPTWKYPA